MPSSTCFTIGAPDITSMGAILIGLTVTAAAGSDKYPRFWWALVGVLVGLAFLCSPVFAALVPIYVALALVVKPDLSGLSRGLMVAWCAALTFLVLFFLTIAWNPIVFWEKVVASLAVRLGGPSFHLWHLWLFVAGTGVAPVAALVVQWRWLLRTPCILGLGATAMGTGALASLVMPTISQEVCSAFGPFLALSAAMALPGFRHPRSATVFTALTLVLLTIATQALFEEWPSPFVPSGSPLLFPLS